MKKIAMLVLLAAALRGGASVITNHVYVVSNVFYHVYHESVITQKVQNTHYNYYFTNNVSVVSNIYETVWRTNMSVNCDIGAQFLAAASNEANRAESYVGAAEDFAAAAASNVTATASSASSAASSAASALNSLRSTQSAGASYLNQINARINWFDEHSGETITQVNITSNVIINVNAQDYSYTYTNAQGTAFDYVTVHPYGANGGATIEARSASSYNTIGIRAWPRPRVSGYWDFYPAYIDYDENGMRLQYLPDTTNPIRYQGGEGVYPDGKIVPEYFYWQGGYIYFKVRVWENGAVVAWCLTRYQWDNWPTTIGYGGDSGTPMELVNRHSYGSSSMGTTLAYFYSCSRAAQGEPIEFPASPSGAHAPTIEWMRNGPVVSVLQDQVAALTNQWADVSGQWTAVSNAWGVFYADASSSIVSSLEYMSNTLVNAANGYPHAYTSPDGTMYSNIVYYDRATDDGKVAITTVGNYYPSLEYRMMPNYGGSSSAYWTFEPAYIDTAANGLRLHYLPKQQATITATTYNSGYKYVPRDFYWQDGVVYMVIDSYNGTTWSGRLKMKYAGTGANAWPNGIYANQAGTGTGQFVQMTFVSREGTIMGTSTSTTGTYGYLKTEYQKVMSSYDSVLWFPESPSQSQQTMIDWLATWVR